MQLVQDSIRSNGGKLVGLNLVYSHSAGQSVRLLRRFKDLLLLYKLSTFSGFGNQGDGLSPG